MSTRETWQVLSSVIRDNVYFLLHRDKMYSLAQDWAFMCTLNKSEPAFILHLTFHQSTPVLTNTAIGNLLPMQFAEPSGNSSPIDQCGIDQVSIPSQLVCAAPWRFSCPAALLSHYPCSQRFTLSPDLTWLWSLPGVGVRGTEAGVGRAVLHFGQEGRINEERLEQLLPLLYLRRSPRSDLLSPSHLSPFPKVCISVSLLQLLGPATWKA